MTKIETVTNNHQNVESVDMILMIFDMVVFSN